MSDASGLRVVLESLDPAFILVVRSVLDGAGIHYVVENGTMAAYFGFFSPGRTRILVDADDEAAARDLLAELARTGGDDPELSEETSGADDAAVILVEAETRAPGPRAARPTSPDERRALPDALRGFALLGMTLANAGSFGSPIVDDPITAAGPDEAALLHAQFLLVSWRFFPIFALLFGWGLWRQLENASDRVPVYTRLFWLALVGAVHAFFVWHGDILLEYAVFGLGVLMLRPRRAADAVFLFGSFVLLPFCILFAGDGFADSALWFPADQATAVAEAAIYASGSFEQIVRQHFTDYWRLQFVTIPAAGLVLAMMVLGFWMGEHGILADPDRHRRWYLRGVAICAPMAVLAGAYQFAMQANAIPLAQDVGGWVVQTFLSVLLPAASTSILYVCMFVLLFQTSTGGRWLRLLAPVGRMSLSVYVFESLAFATLYYSFGFGLYGTLGATEQLLVGLGAFALAAVMSTIFLRRFRYGPLEALLRRVSYSSPGGSGGTLVP